MSIPAPQTSMLDIGPASYTSLVDAFEQSCKRFADRTAFTCMGQELTFADLDRHSAALARFLRDDQGLIQGDRVAVQLPNLLQYPIAAWGVIRAGLVLVNTNPLYTERELRHQFRDASVRVVITLNELLPMIEKVSADTDIESAIVAPLVPSPEGNVLPESKISLQRWDDVITAKTEAPRVDCSMQSLAVLQYTGGTTGLSKGAMLSHANIYASSLQSTAIWDDLFPDVKRPILVAAMPVYHIFGFCVNIISGVLDGRLSIMIPDPRNTDSIIDAFKNHPVTAFSGVNTLFVPLMQHPEFDTVDFSSLKGVIAGGAALVPEVAKEWEQRTGCHLYEGYGLSETSAVGCCNLSGSGRQLGTVGRPVVGCEVRIVDAEDGNPLPAGAEGELQIRGPQVLVGYWGNDEATRKSLTEDGWFATGDVALIQEDGFVRIVDRLKDMILVSGFNVYPNEVESVLYEHPAVIECAVIGEPSAKSGELVKAVVVAEKEVPVEELIEFCKERLAGYKVPKLVEFRSELPKSNVGKILRRELRPTSA